MASATKTFSLVSNDPNDRGVYEFQVFGKTDSSVTNPEGVSAVFEVEMVCFVNTVVSSVAMSGATYYVGATATT